MSVYKRGRLWHYDFVYKGRRFYGPTGQDTKRAAETVERAERLKAATGAGQDAGELTLDMAAGKYWDEVAFEKRDARNLQRRLTVMIECVGKTKKLNEIDAPDVVSAIAKRRGRLHRGKPPSPATVNRDIIDTTLRPILYRARKVWKAKGLAEIAWKDIRLGEPKGVVREYTDAQIEAWKGHLAPVPRFALHMLLTYGLRFGELMIRPSAVLGEERLLAIEGKYRKNAEILYIPLITEDARLLAAMAGRAKALGFETVLHRGEPPERYTYDGLYHALRKGAKDAGLDMGRLIHGARHHAATRLLRRTGDVKKVQKLLGHSSIISTARYAHVDVDDLRADLDDLSRNNPATGSGNASKDLKSNEK